MLGTDYICCLALRLVSPSRATEIEQIQGGSSLGQNNNLPGKWDLEIPCTTYKRPYSAAYKYSISSVVSGIPLAFRTEILSHLGMPILSYKDILSNSSNHYRNCRKEPLYDPLQYMIQQGQERGSTAFPRSIEVYPLLAGTEVTVISK